MSETPIGRYTVGLVVAVALVGSLMLQILALVFLPGLYGVVASLCLWAVGLIVASGFNGSRTRVTWYFVAACLAAGVIIAAIQVVGE